MLLSALTVTKSNWSIAVRVCAKSAIRATKAGQVFAVDLMDSVGDEIRATAFQAAVDKVSAQMDLHGTYVVSNFTLSPRNEKFNKLAHSLEIRFDSDVRIAAVDAARAISLACAPKFFTTILQVITVV